MGPHTMTVHKLYWTENNILNASFYDELTDMLKDAEMLRKRAWAGEDIRFISSASEVSESVGKQGVDVTGSDYNWKKRRP